MGAMSAQGSFIRESISQSKEGNKKTEAEVGVIQGHKPRNAGRPLEAAKVRKQISRRASRKNTALPTPDFSSVRPIFGLPTSKV